MSTVSATWMVALRPGPMETWLGLSFTVAGRVCGVASLEARSLTVVVPWLVTVMVLRPENRSVDSAKPKAQALASLKVPLSVWYLSPVTVIWLLTDWATSTRPAPPRVRR